MSQNNHATDPQKRYLKRLLHEAFSHLCNHGLCIDPNHISDRMTKSEASQAIDALLKLKAAGWPREAKKPVEMSPRMVPVHAMADELLANGTCVDRKDALRLAYQKVYPPKPIEVGDRVVYESPSGRDHYFYFVTAIHPHTGEINKGDTRYDVIDVVPDGGYKPCTGPFYRSDLKRAPKAE